MKNVASVAPASNVPTFSPSSLPENTQDLNANNLSSGSLVSQDQNLNQQNLPSQVPDHTNSLTQSSNELQILDLTSGSVTPDNQIDSNLIAKPNIQASSDFQTKSSSASSNPDGFSDLTDTPSPNVSSTLSDLNDHANSVPSTDPTFSVNTTSNITSSPVADSQNPPLTSSVSPTEPIPFNQGQVASPMLPPVRLPSDSSVSHPPTAFADTGELIQRDIVDTTERESSYATALASKVNGVDPLTLRPEPPAPLKKEVTADGVKIKDPIKASENKPPSKKKSLKSNLKIVAGATLMLLIVAGAGIGIFLQQQQQDTRRDAASEEVTNTEIARTPEEWQTFSKNWQAFIANDENDWPEYVAYSRSEGARYNCDAPIMKVGEETLYGCDLNAMFVISDIKTYIQPQSLSPQLSQLNAVLDLLITDSALLQEAEKTGDVELNANIYNNPQKNTEERFATLRQVRKLFDGKYEKTVDFEAISIYFHNQEEPAIGTEKSRQAAEIKMNALYERLKSGEITMEQAGQEIKADKIIGDTSEVSLAQMDPVFRENAYFNVKGHKFFARIFRDEVYDDELRSLGEGQMSTVRVCKDYKYTSEELLRAEETGEPLNAPFIDSCFIIFKVNKINLGLFPDSNTNVENHVQQEYQTKTDKLLQ